MADDRARARDADRVAGVRITHPDRVLYPEQGLTKRALAEYYAELADRILPHVAGRPLSVVRCPRGREEACFYQKHLGEGFDPAGYTTRDMVSGAGHDAAYLARVVPTTMIFVPCAGGISHNEEESTTFEECAAGAQVLLNAVLEYDRRLGG